MAVSKSPFLSASLACFRRLTKYSSSSLVSSIGFFVSTGVGFIFSNSSLGVNFSNWYGMIN
jgi:uncharacterized membrane protein YwaF